MNYNQNKKIAQITSQTLIIGVDIAKFKHVARAQDLEEWSSDHLVILKIQKRGSGIFLHGFLN
jgi:transposase